MEIEARNPAANRFSAIACGQAFQFGSLIWMKIKPHDRFNAVLLATGELDSFSDNAVITHINAKVVVE
jgi:hypothetical protein